MSKIVIYLDYNDLRALFVPGIIKSEKDAENHTTKSSSSYVVILPS